MTDRLPRRPPVVPPVSAPRAAEMSAREALARAKEASLAERPKTEITGRFDEPVPEDMARQAARPATAPTQLSEDSARGLAAMAEEQRRVAAAAPAAVEAVPELGDREAALRAMNAVLDVAEQYDDRPRLIKEAFTALKSTPPPTPLELERKRVEATLRKIDIGQYIMMGYIEQEVPVLSTAEVTLRAVFRSAQDKDDEFLERELRRFRNTTPPPAPLEFMRHQTRLALALQLRSYNGTKWPSVRAADGSVDPDAFAQCVERVHAIPSHIIQRLAQHAAWFNERIEAALSDREVLSFG